jgi:hypothetical protein
LPEGSKQQELLAEKRYKMSRASLEGRERAKKTADKYFNRSGDAALLQLQGCGRNDKGLELAKHKQKIRNQKEEIDKLKRALRAQNGLVSRLQNANNYLSRTAESEKD